MYAVIEKNMLHISLARFYRMDWYGKDWLSKRETFDFEYGSLEMDTHKNGKKYLTGFTIDPRAFIVDYLRTRYKKELRPSRRIESVSVDTSVHSNMFSVDFLKSHGFVVDGMEKDLIFPKFVRQGGRTKIQGFDVLSPISVINYLSKRFKFNETSLVRMGAEVCDLKTNRRWSLEKKKKVSK